MTHHTNCANALLCNQSRIALAHMLMYDETKMGNTVASKTCAESGKDMVCPKCASPISATDHFCENCGHQLSGAPAADSVAAVQTCHCPPGQSKPDEDGYCEVCGIRCVAEAEVARKHVELSIDAHLAIVSDVGRRHPTNQDAGVVARGSGDSIVMVIADGVSMSANSASASEAAVGAAVNVLLATPDDADIVATVRAAVESANQAVLALPDPGGAEDGPETTIVAAFCRDGRVTVGWAGDSRAYLIGVDYAMEQLTVDDSWVEEAVRNGEMSREQAIVDKRAHYVTQVLGMRDQQLDVHVVERELSAGSSLLLCSDGLWNYFQADGELVAALRQCDANAAISLCQCLVNAANERGGHDNVTVAVLRGTN